MTRNQFVVEVRTVLTETGPQLNKVETKREVRRMAFGDNTCQMRTAKHAFGMMTQGTVSKAWQGDNGGKHQMSWRVTTMAFLRQIHQRKERR